MTSPSRFFISTVLWSANWRWQVWICIIMLYLSTNWGSTRYTNVTWFLSLPNIKTTLREKNPNVPFYSRCLAFVCQPDANNLQVHPHIAAFIYDKRPTSRISYYIYRFKYQLCHFKYVSTGNFYCRFSSLDKIQPLNHSFLTYFNIGKWSLRYPANIYQYFHPPSRLVVGNGRQ